MHILLISNDDIIIARVNRAARQAVDLCTVAKRIGDAREAVSGGDVDAVLMDCSLRAAELIAFAGEFQEYLAESVVLLLGPLDHEQREQLSQRLSAHYSIDKPLRDRAFADMLDRIRMRVKIVRQAGMIGRSPAMEETIQTIMQVGPTPISVLITGESGTGKEVAARAIHSVSRRADKPFLPVNCAALAEGVLESELFGHEKGAFTGAAGRRIGMFEQAHGGTIFLDEIGEIPSSTQIRLLRVLEEREIMRVGGTEVIPVDVRVITATNRNLLEIVEQGSFRRDLYYRIKVLELKVPPLRERPEDIPLLLHRLASVYAQENDLPLRTFSADAASYLSRLPWSGNVRELRNFVESTLALTSAHTVGVDNIPGHLLSDLSGPAGLPVKSTSSAEAFERELLYHSILDLRREIAEIKQLILDYAAGIPAGSRSDLEITPVYQPGETLEDLEREAILDALEQHGGNRRRAAEHLGIGERTLYRKLKLYGITS